MLRRCSAFPGNDKGGEATSLPAVANNNNKMIGVFDSGIGGLTVVKEIWKILGPYQIIYFGDTAHAPYGNRGEETIKKFTQQGIDFLSKKGVKIIVIACHTASAVYQDLFKNHHLPILEMVSPTVEAAINCLNQEKKIKSKKIGILATSATVNSKIYEREIQKKCLDCQIFSSSAPLLVPLIEQGWTKKIETKRILKKYLRPLKNKRVNCLVLACTHYPLIEQLIKIKMGPSTHVINPGREMAQQLKGYLEKHWEIKKGLSKDKSQFYFSDLSPHYSQLIKRFLGPTSPWPAIFETK